MPTKVLWDGVPKMLENGFLTEISREMLVPINEKLIKGDWRSELSARGKDGLPNF